jgi:exodeoxyribonuclease VII large subunit
MKVEPLDYGDRKVFTVAGFNRGVSDWVARLPTLWIEGEVTELRRNANWASVFFTLRDPEDGSCLPASIPRRTFDALRLDLADGERIHVYGRPELYAAKGEFRLRALSLERFGVGEQLAAIERLKRALAAEGLFDASRKRPLPRFPRRIGLVTGSDAAARRDVIATIQTRFPPARVLVAETLVQGPRAAAGICEALRAVAEQPGIDVIVLTRGGGSFDDLLPFSDECVVRAVATCPVPVVSAVGHEQDAPLCDLAADVRASTPTAAGKLVVPDLEALRADLVRARGRRSESASGSCARCAASSAERGRRSNGGGRRSAVRRDGCRRSRRGRRSSAGTRSSGPATRSSATRPRWPRARASRSSSPAAPSGRASRTSVSELTFETAQRELEQVVERLERGEASLDEAIGLWERGEELLRFCLTRLETAEGKVEELAQRLSNGAAEG